MPESPDFDAIAHAIKWSIPDDKVDTEFIAEQLRLVWNARGAADLATIEAALAVKPPDILEQLRSLDR
jgi:hypothetical protein